MRQPDETKDQHYFVYVCVDPCTTHFDQVRLILHETAVGIRHVRDREVCAWRLAQSFVFLCLLQFSEVLLAFAL